MGPDDAPEERMASKDEIARLELPSLTKPNPRVEASPTGPMGLVDPDLDDSDKLWQEMFGQLKQEEEYKEFNRGVAAEAGAREAHRQQQLEEEASQLPQRLPDESIKDYLERTEPERADDDTQLTQPIKDASKRKRFGIF